MVIWEFSGKNQNIKLATVIAAKIPIVREIPFFDTINLKSSGAVYNWLNDSKFLLIFRKNKKLSFLN